MSNMKENSMGSIYLKGTSNIVPECISTEMPRSVE